jgi:hypothetical protein
MRSAWKWIVAGLLVVAAAAAYVYFRARGNKAATAGAAASIFDAIAGPGIEKKQAELVELKNDLNADSASIAVAQKAIDDAKAKLVEQYKSVDLPADEVARRLSDLSL